VSESAGEHQDLHSDRNSTLIEDDVLADEAAANIDEFDGEPAPRKRRREGLPPTSGCGTIRIELTQCAVGIEPELIGQFFDPASTLHPGGPATASSLPPLLASSAPMAVASTFDATVPSAAPLHSCCRRAPHAWKSRVS
jgi:hypothetical protein